MPAIEYTFYLLIKDDLKSQIRKTLKYEYINNFYFNNNGHKSDFLLAFLRSNKIIQDVKYIFIMICF